MQPRVEAPRSTFRFVTCPLADCQGTHPLRAATYKDFALLKWRPQESEFPSRVDKNGVSNSRICVGSLVVSIASGVRVSRGAERLEQVGRTRVLRSVLPSVTHPRCVSFLREVELLRGSSGWVAIHILDQLCLGVRSGVW